jgi:hypothetical protein
LTHEIILWIILSAGGDIFDLTREVVWEQGIKFQSPESDGKKSYFFIHHIQTKKLILPDVKYKNIYIYIYIINGKVAESVSFKGCLLNIFFKTQ